MEKISNNKNNKILLTINLGRIETLKINLERIESLKIQKSNGLALQGHFNEAQILINEIDMTKFDQTYVKIIEFYNTNTIYPFGNHDEAIKIFLENEVKINEWLKTKKLKLQMMSIIAIYNFYINNYTESKRLLNEMKKNKIYKLTYVEIEYLFALIDIREGREDEGRKRLSTLLEPTKKLYLHNTITKLLES